VSGPDAARVDLVWEAAGDATVARVSYHERRLNLVGTPGFTALEEAFERLRRRDDLRAVILTGGGRRAFVGGADIGEMATLEPPTARRFITRLHGICQTIRELPVPVVARIDGYCLGAGLEIAACCDLRLAATGARFGMPEVRVGIPSVIEAAVLPRLIGLGRTQDLVLTGRMVDAAEAYRMGLVDGVAVSAEELDQLVGERIAQLALGGARALAAQKVLIRQWQELPLSAAVEAGIDAFERSWESDEPNEKMRAFLRRER
jgi:enoyl-CoA hydratase/carnithine racemase